MVNLLKVYAPNSLKVKFKVLNQEVLVKRLGLHCETQPYLYPKKVEVGFFNSQTS